MACDEQLVARIRRDLHTTPALGERRMFGGVCFTLNGNMVCGVVKDELMVRVGGDAYELALARPDVRKMGFTGRPMRGYGFVSAEGVQSDKALWSWIERGLAFVGTLAPKVPESKRT